MLANASWLEIGWTLCALPGLLLSTYNVYGAVSDLQTHWTDGFRKLGWVGFAKVVLVALAALMVIAVGVQAMQTPEPVRPENQETAAKAAVYLLVIDACILGLAVAFTIERAFIVPHIHIRSERPEDKQ